MIRRPDLKTCPGAASHWTSREGGHCSDRILDVGRGKRHHGTCGLLLPVHYANSELILVSLLLVSLHQG